VGTGAFYAGGSPELRLQVDNAPPWGQPWNFAEREWEYQNLTLTGEAAAIDQQARDEERARLRELWANVTPLRWTTAFQTPITDFLEVSANYGARRSYNGGPYLTYHEGVDFSAYAGTPVYAPAAGAVVLAEQLYVRGGAVIIDHGLGIFSGYYHLSAVHTQVGQEVAAGDLLGEVGTTGLSTGNHLHWDMLINSIWVDAAAWQQQELACWLLEGLGQACAAPTG
jgi:murein DD-endopeptidase MepM/ murein hydrolase activator NlpD